MLCSLKCPFLLKIQLKQQYCEIFLDLQISVFLSCCSRNIDYYYQCWKKLCIFHIFVEIVKKCFCRSFFISLF